jgi:hypothetical protein
VKHMAIAAGLGLFGAGLLWAQPSSSPGGAHEIAWVKDLTTAQRLAQAQKKLVLEFLMLGDLLDPHC